MSSSKIDIAELEGYSAAHGEVVQEFAQILNSELGRDLDLCREQCVGCSVYDYCNGGCPIFKSKDHKIEEFDQNSDYCNYKRSFFDFIINEDKRKSIKNIYAYEGVE